MAFRFLSLFSKGSSFATSILLRNFAHLHRPPLFVPNRVRQMSARTVPEYSMDNIPISGLQELETHLQLLLGDPSLPFNVKLLDDVELQLTGMS